MVTKTPYDPDSDFRYTPQNLHEAEQKASQDAYDREFNGIADNIDNTTDHPLGDQEAAATGQNNLKGNTNSGLGSSSTDSANDTVGQGFTKGDGNKKGFRGRLQGLRHRKGLLIAAAGGGGGLIAILVLLFLLASALEIPNLMQNITSYEFARVTRQYAESAERVTTEKLAADSLDDATWSQALKDKYQNLRDNTWGKFDKYRPEQVMKNLKASDNFQLSYQKTATGRLQLKGVTLTDRTYLPVQRGAVQRFTPGLSSVLEFKDGVSLSKNVAPALDAALRAQDIGPIVRGSVAKSIRQELGIGLVAWKLGQFKGKDATQARLEEARQKAATVDEKTPENNAKTAPLKDSVDDAEKAAQETLDDDKSLQSTIDSGGVSSGVKSAIANGIAKSGLQDVLGVVNPVYGVAMPACIVYDGSLNNSGPTIDSQTRQQAAAYQYLASGADQQKAGSQSTDATDATELATAIHATNDDLGDISGSNAMKRASGETIDSSTSVSPEASASGEFTLLDATPGIPSAVAATINSIADEACPALTNIWGGVGLGLLNIGVAILSGGTSAGGEEAAGQAATQVIEHTATGLVDRLVTNTVGKAATKVSKLRDLLYDTGKSATKVAAATVVAKLIVNARAGQVNGGFTQGQALADEADSGGGVYANMISQKQLYGRPLTQSEVTQSDATDQKTIAKADSSKSMYERYLATSNAHSLIDRMAIGVNANMNTSFLRSLATIAGTLFHPMTYLGSFATAFNGSAKAAASDQHYGNVQFGFSQSEENLIDNTESYRVHLENQRILDASDKEDTIATTYGDCFSKSIGDLLSSGEIVRDSDGNVIADQGLCAPNNLGPDNSTYGDLVFRYRIAKSSDTTVDQLVDSQEVTANDSAAAGSTGTYKNPLRDIKHLVPERIDGGVDYNGDDGPIYAIGNGKVISANTGEWPGNPGVYLLYQLSDGPAQGKYVYMAEDCTPLVKKGDTVTADTAICKYHYSGTAMEMGWSRGTDAYITDDYTSHGEGSYASNGGLNFSALLKSLGAPPGEVQGSKSHVPMPAGWPTW